MIFLLLAPGFEEIEATSALDVLRRANLAVAPIAVQPDPHSLLVSGAQGLCVKCNCHIDQADLDCPDLVILPGGSAGTLNLKKHPKVREGLISRMEKNQPVAAICAAPSLLGQLGLLQGKKAICYPGLEDELKGAQIIQEDVVQDGKLITSRGPATAMAFALACLEMMTDKETRDKIAKDLLFS